MAKKTKTATTATTAPTIQSTEKKKRSPNHYIDKEDFLNRIVEYRKSVRQAKKDKKPKPKIPDHLARFVIQIAENAAKNPLYSRYTFKDIMIADAIENCIRYFDNFDPSRSTKNPFGYFSTCCIYAFWRRIGLEKEELYGKYKIAQQSGALDELHGNIENNGNEAVQQSQLYDNLNEFIRKYEEGLAKKKEKKAIKKAEKKKVAAKGLEKFARAPKGVRKSRKSK